MRHRSRMPSSSARPEATTGHRGWNRHPPGIRVGSGGSPWRIDLRGAARLRHHVQQGPRVGVARTLQDLLGGPDLDDAPEVHHRDPVGHGPGQAEVVGDDHDRDPQLVAQLHQQREDLAADRCVEVRHGLVGDDHGRVEHEGARDHDPLALAAGQLVRVQEEEALGRPQPGPRQGPRDQLVLALLVRAFVDPVDPQALGDDLVDRLARVERRRRVLEHHLDVPPVRAQILRAVGQPVAPVPDLCPRWARSSP